MLFLLAGVGLGVLAGYAVAIARRSNKDYKTAKNGVRMLGPKRLVDTWYAALAIIVVVVALAMYGTQL